jgi:hypothetical protein
MDSVISSSFWTYPHKTVTKKGKMLRETSPFVVVSSKDASTGTQSPLLFNIIFLFGATLRKIKSLAGTLRKS